MLSSILKNIFTKLTGFFSQHLKNVSMFTMFTMFSGFYSAVEKLAFCFMVVPVGVMCFLLASFKVFYLCACAYSCIQTRACVLYLSYLLEKNFLNCALHFYSDLEIIRHYSFKCWHCLLSASFLIIQRWYFLTVCHVLLMLCTVVFIPFYIFSLWTSVLDPNFRKFGYFLLDLNFSTVCLQFWLLYFWRHPISS